MTASLRELVAEELSTAVDPRVGAMASAIAAKHGPASRAVLFYGSCLREKQLDGLMLDFYLIVSDYRSAYAKQWLATANRLIPPNVFYFENQGLRAKYAVLSENDFRRECDVSGRTASVFARFSQPSRLVWAADEDSRNMAVDAVARAAPALLELTRPTMGDAEARNVLNIWKRGLEFTFGAEIRAERKSRGTAIVDSDPERYRRFARAAGFPRDLGLNEKQREIYADAWRQFRKRGKRASVLRLAKASLTFAGGAEYIAWKINRHAGTDIELTPWQRRHPLLTAVRFLPRLIRTGAVR